MSVIGEAVEFALSVNYGDFQSELIHTSKRAMIDYLGVTLAGSKEPVSICIRDYITSMASRPEATVLGAELRTSQNCASLANGVAGHALDFDDVSWTTIGHPSVVVMAATLACAEKLHSSGREVLKAYVLGVEIQHKIAELLMPEASEHGWHTTSVFGPFGAATASAILAGLNYEQFCFALGIAASMAGGVRSNFGTMTKPYHAGMAAFNGVTAAILAGHGMNASFHAIEAQDGFMQAFSGKCNREYRLSWGDPWDILKPGLVFKRYPCCSGAHPAIDCILEMRDRQPFAYSDVESIHVGVSLLGPRELVCHCPTTPSEAKFSMEYAVTAAIVHGKVGLSEYTSKAVEDARARQLMSKITVEIDPDLARLGFIGTAPAKIRVTLKSGKILEGECDLARGNPEKPLSDDDLGFKFVECASRVLTPDKCRKTLNTLLDLEVVKDINEVVDLLAISTDGPSRGA